MTEGWMELRREKNKSIVSLLSRRQGLMDGLCQQSAIVEAGLPPQISADWPMPFENCSVVGNQRYPFISIIYIYNQATTCMYADINMNTRHLLYNTQAINMYIYIYVQAYIAHADRQLVTISTRTQVTKLTMGTIAVVASLKCINY